MNALSGTGAAPVEVPLLEDDPPPPPELPDELEDELRELAPDVLAVCEAADTPPAPDNTLLPADPDRAEVWPLETFEDPPTDRFMTPCTAVKDDPVLLVAGDSRALPDEAAPPEPAPEEDPAVLEATAVVVPFCVDCM
jgi:hypothetical protein